MPKTALKTLTLASSGLSIPNICFGTTALANMPDTYGYSVGEERARATLDAIFDGPIAFLDTSRNYGLGESEKSGCDEESKMHRWTIRARGWTVSSPQLNASRSVATPWLHRVATLA